MGAFGMKIAATGVIIGMSYLVLDIACDGRPPHWIGRIILSAAASVALLGVAIAVWSA